MQLSFVTLDVFTNTPLVGNPVAIIHVPRSASLPQDVKQAIAREFNLSEIVFLHEQTEDDAAKQEARIDIFTSIAEVPFAGHPTIGSGVYLLHYLKNTEIAALKTKAGRKTIAKAETGVNIHLAHDVHIHNTPFPNTSFSTQPVVSIVKGMTFILAKLPNLEELAKQAENLLGVRETYTSQNALDDGWREGLIGSLFYVDMGIDHDSGRRRLRTRMFASREDPGTGSASSALCSHLSLSESGPQVRKFHLTQGVEMNRQCDIFVEVTLKEDGKSIESVMLSGNAVKTMEGTLEVPLA